MNRYTLRTFSLEVVMIAATAVIAIPLYVLVNLAIRPVDDLTSPLAPTKDPTFGNFTAAWSQGHLGSAFISSITVTVVSVAIVLAISTLAAYPIARVARGWSTFAFILIMIGLLLPFQLAALPLYQTMRDLGLLGSVWSLVLYYSGLQVPFTTFLYIGFMRALPIEYEEAALIDGCTPLKVFRHIVIPELKPITATALVLNAVFIWNDFFTPLLYLSGSTSRTLPVAVASFVGQFVSQWNLIFAALIISIVPVLIIYFLLQRSIINSFAGGLKG